MGSERNTAGYLIKVQAECPNAPERIELSTPEVTFGRGVGNTVIWESLQVSRRHATMEYKMDTNSWRLKDTSTNGMMLNNQRVPRNVFVDVKDQDLISFVPTGSLTYRYNFAPPRPSTTQTEESSLQALQYQPRKSLDSSVQILESLSKSPKRKTGYSKSQDCLNLSPPCDRKRKRLAESVPAETRRSSDEPEELLDIDPVPEFCFDNKVPVITANSPNSYSYRNVMVANMENFLQNDKLSEEGKQLRLYKERIEQLELEKYEAEKRHRLETQELKVKLQLTESEKRVFEEEVFKKVSEVMEHEFSCCICNEIFIQATVVDCGHTFCGHCISEWVKRKNECPNCRKVIKSQQRHTEMENYINKYHSLLPEDHLLKRNEVIGERQREVEVVRAAAAASRNQARRGHEHLAFAFPATDRLQISDFLQSMNDMIMQNPSARLVSGGGIQDYYPGPDVIPHRIQQQLGGMYRVDPAMGRAENLGPYAGRRSSRVRVMPMDPRPGPVPTQRRTRAGAHVNMPMPPTAARTGPHLDLGVFPPMDVLTVD